MSLDNDMLVYVHIAQMGLGRLTRSCATYPRFCRLNKTETGRCAPPNPLQFRCSSNFINQLYIEKLSMVKKSAKMFQLLL